MKEPARDDLFPCWFHFNKRKNEKNKQKKILIFKTMM